MTSDELKAAAKVVLRWDREFDGGVTEHVAKNLAKAYLARLAADEQQAKEDAEPITEEWGLANGAGRDDGGGIAWKIWERGQDESTEEPAFHILRSQGSLWLECYSASGDTLGLIELMTPPTRGQLRKLLEALKGSTWRRRAQPRYQQTHPIQYRSGFDSGWTTHAAYEHSRDLVRANLIPQWEDRPEEDTHARCPWWWCEDCGPESPPQLLRCYRPLKVNEHGLTVDMQVPKEWIRWTVAGWVPLVGRVCPIGARPK